jgi:hypothetical protein
MMTRREAIAIASELVSALYAFVPPVALVTQVKENRPILGGPKRSDILHPHHIMSVGDWLICFKCSHTTDAFGMPGTLVLLVDSHGNATLMEPKDEADSH